MSLILLGQKDEGDTTTIYHGQDIHDILKMNYLDRKRSDEHWSKDPDMKHVARVPMAIYLEWQKLGITEDDYAFFSALEIHKSLKTTEKRLAKERKFYGPVR